MQCHSFIRERKGEGSWRKGEAPCKIHFRSWVSCSSTHCLNQQDTASQFCIVLQLHLNVAQDFQGCKSKRVKGSLICNGLVNIVVYRANCTSSSAAEHTSSSVIAPWETIFPQSCFSSFNKRVGSKTPQPTAPLLNVATPWRGAARSVPELQLFHL